MANVFHWAIHGQVLNIEDLFCIFCGKKSNTEINVTEAGTTVGL